MMSLATANLAEIVKKQYFFKLKANIDSFSSLIWIQLLGILFSLGGSGSMGSFSDYLHVDVRYHSADVVIAFTMIWAFVTAIIITTKPYRNHDFTFVTNRLSSSIANILFLLTASMIGAITALLSRNLLKMAAYFLVNEQIYSVDIGFSELMMGVCATVLYLFCIGSIGYFIGALVQVSKFFIVLIPTILIGSLFLDGLLLKDPTITNIIKFYLYESSILLFMVKILLTVSAFFIASIGIFNRLEVRR